MKGCLKESEFGAGVSVQDADREIAFTLLSLAYEFDRWEIDQVVAYVVYIGGIEVGRLVIAPSIGTSSQVRIREHYTTLSQPQQHSLQLCDDAADLSGKESNCHSEFMSLCCQIRRILESLQGAAGSGAADKDSHQLRPEPTVVGMSRRVNGIMKDSDHFAYPRSKRMEIVQHYRLDCINGEVRNKDHWARRNYQISSRTLFNYEREFPQVEESVSALSIAGPAGSG